MQLETLSLTDIEIVGEALNRVSSSLWKQLMKRIAQSKTRVDVLDAEETEDIKEGALQKAAEPEVPVAMKLTQFFLQSRIDGQHTWDSMAKF